MDNGLKKLNYSKSLPDFSVSYFVYVRPLSPLPTGTGDTHIALKVIHPLQVTNTCFDRLACASQTFMPRRQKYAGGACLRLTIRFHWNSGLKFTVIWDVVKLDQTVAELPKVLVYPSKWPESGHLAWPQMYKIQHSGMKTVFYKH